MPTTSVGLYFERSHAMTSCLVLSVAVDRMRECCFKLQMTTADAKARIPDSPTIVEPYERANVREQGFYRQLRDKGKMLATAKGLAMTASGSASILC